MLFATLGMSGVFLLRKTNLFSMKKITLSFGLTLFVSFVCQSQIISKHYYPKIVVPDGQEYLVQTDSLYLDTLILGDNSKLKFLYARTKMIVENAFAGDNCLWDAAGKNGANGTSGSLDGEHGEDGKNLVLVIVFRELKHLLIRTDGGAGGNGFHASTGRSMSVNGGNAGDGGDGGLLELHYSSVGFLPRFNEKSEHSISFCYTGGNAGHLGFGKKDVKRAQPAVEKEYYHSPGGKSVRAEISVASEPSGTNGHSGSPGSEGQLILKRFD
jgi:hypothetical protein